jgi:hypothetical protein
MPRYPSLLNALLCVATAMMLAGCGNKSATIRYRVTARVVVDGKVYEGSTVRKTSFTETPHSLTGFAVSVSDKGEAVAIDVGNQRSTIYLLRNGSSGSAEFPYIVLNCFGVMQGAADSDWIKALADVPIRQKCILTPGTLEKKKIMPLVVAFRDETVPKSIFELTQQNFQEAFGVKAWFAELQLERVDDRTPLDRNIDKRLPWLNQIPFDGTHFRMLDPHVPRGMPASEATLAQSATDYYFRD